MTEQASRRMRISEEKGIADEQVTKFINGNSFAQSGIQVQKFIKESIIIFL